MTAKILSLFRGTKPSPAKNETQIIEHERAMAAIDLNVLRAKKEKIAALKVEQKELHLTIVRYKRECDAHLKHYELTQDQRAYRQALAKSDICKRAEHRCRKVDAELSILEA